MGVPGSANPLLLATAQDATYTVSRSLRFNAPDSAYLSRTPGSAGNRKTWTWSGWVKRSNLSTGDNQILFEGYASGSAVTNIFFHATNGTLVFDNYTGTSAQCVTNAVFRDCSAWYHIVLAVDTTQGTAANRVKLYVNGSQQTYSSASYPSQNADLSVNVAGAHGIGARYNGSTGSIFFNGYLAEIHFVDGSSLTPASFGETNAITGQWVPKAYTGSYGTNGFKLTFSYNSNTTSATLGKDTSGNNNDWSPTNFSVAAGAGNDSLVDTPVSSGTDTGTGGEVKGNYCTLNPLDNGSAVLTNGNLDWDSTGNQGTRSTFFVSSGKWYWEITYNQSNLISEHGVATRETQALTGGFAFPGAVATSWGFSNSSGNKSNNASFTNITGAGAQNDVVMVALDMDNGKIWWGRNGTWLGSGNPATGANAAFSNLAGNTVAPMAGVGGADAGAVSYNFGARSWAYAAPSGFKALCDTNLPTPVVAKPSTVFDTKLYTGNGSTQNITGLGFSPDLVWIKSRSQAGYYHILTDSVRGTNKQLFSNDTLAEESRTDRLTAFNSDGFSLGSYGDVNQSTGSHAAWCWDAGSSNSTNNAGSITSTVRANASAGFSIVTFTSQASGSATVGHGLGVAPQFIITKARNISNGWGSYHVSIGSGSYIALHSTAAATSGTLWNNTNPTANVFSLGSDFAYSYSMVAYCFAPVANFSAFGSYTGNGSTDGPFVYSGFRPRWVLTKRTDSTSDWFVYDAARDPSNVVFRRLTTNLSDAEGGAGDVLAMDFTANGWKIRTTNAAFNANAGTYVYAAFAESPFQYARAR